VELIINGDKKELDVKTITELVHHYELQYKTIIIEVDGEIVDKQAWSSTGVKPGMKIELVHFVGGG
jgi:sulfur carrier protein